MKLNFAFALKIAIIPREGGSVYSILCVHSIIETLNLFNIVGHVFNNLNLFNWVGIIKVAYSS